jgi:pimeloyl-ACP methyl ester carboxylesterase
MRMRRRSYVGIAVGLTLLALGAGAVREAGAWAIVQAPNHGGIARSSEPPLDVARALRVEVGPPSAELEAWVVDPPRAPRGTVLVLHGIRSEKRGMLPVARMLRDAGFRAVLVDLRGHGGSSGEWLTYGVVESQDLLQLVDTLEALRWIEGPLSVYGASYGGAVGIQLAARDPRVRAVVSLSTFASLREVAPSYASHAAWGLGALLPGALVDSIVTDSAHLGGFDPESADTARAIGRTRAPVLLLHGDADAHVPYSHAEELADSCAHCELVAIHGADHAGALGSPQARAAALRWIERFAAR